MVDILQIGAVTAPHGVRGEAKIYPMTDDISRFKKLKEVYLGEGEDRKTVHISSVKFFKNMVILKFDEFNTPEEIDRLRKTGLYVTRDMAVELEDDEYFIADLIGVKVFDDDDILIGEISDVMQTGANDVYVVRLVNGSEMLVPAIKDCVRRVDVADGQMWIHVMPGLMNEE